MMINCLNYLLVISYVENSILNFTEVIDFIQEFDVQELANTKQCQTLNFTDWG